MIIRIFAAVAVALSAALAAVAGLGLKPSRVALDALAQPRPPFALSPHAAISCSSFSSAISALACPRLTRLMRWRISRSSSGSSRVHHAAKDWDDGGNTNIDEETLACKPHNLLVENSGWSTRKRKDGRTEWIPPPHLDTGQARINNYHRPENYLLEDGDEDGGR